MADIAGIDPRTGRPVEVVARKTTTEGAARLCAAALAAPMPTLSDEFHEGGPVFLRRVHGVLAGGTGQP